jgi:transketolase
VHVPTIKPLDVEAVVAAAEKTGLVVTSEEHTIVGGLGGAIAEALAENSPLPMKLHGLRDVFGESGPDDQLLDKYGLAAPHIAAAVHQLVEGRTT